VKFLGRMTPDEAVDRGFLDGIGALAGQPLRSAARMGVRRGPAGGGFVERS
jgi:hypothetical protein